MRLGTSYLGIEWNRGPVEASEARPEAESGRANGLAQAAVSAGARKLITHGLERGTAELVARAGLEEVFRGFPVVSVVFAVPDVFSAGRALLTRDPLAPQKILKAGLSVGGVEFAGLGLAAGALGVAISARESSNQRQALFEQAAAEPK